MMLIRIVPEAKDNFRWGNVGKWEMNEDDGVRGFIHIISVQVGGIGCSRLISSTRVFHFLRV